MTDTPRPPLPPFNVDSATLKIRAAEDSWTSRNPQRVALAYCSERRWRNRAGFVLCRAQIVAFLIRKWKCEFDERLAKELWPFADARIAVRFADAWHDATGNWFRSYGHENRTSNAQGWMAARHASANELAIAASTRRFRWLLGRRPDEQPGLSALGL